MFKSKTEIKYTDNESCFSTLEIQPINWYKFKIVTNGEVFRVQGRTNENMVWEFIEDREYFEKYNIWQNRPVERDSKDKIIEYIRAKFGDEGVKKIEKEWWPC